MMLGTGQGMEAFEKHYHENVTMIESTGEVREGKDYNRKYEEEFFGSVHEVHGGGVDHLTSDEDNGVTMVESWMDVTFKDGNRVKMQEVARQVWQGDQIIEEKFYYNPAMMQPINQDEQQATTESN